MTDSKFSEVIGGYELVRSLGRGGMAEVWVARKPVGDKGSKYVAIKLIAEHFLDDPRYARMFRAEAELAAALNHANIVQVFEHGEDAGRSYLVMEWVDGLNLLKLEERLAYVDEPRRFRLASYVVGQLLHALHYAHRILSADGHPLGVVHRDVSPQNVLVSNNGEVKLTDFGVAHHNFEESSGMHVKGKVRYMPPEQLSGQSRAPTVDLYAVGALLHEMLDGKKFRGAYEDGQDLFTVVLSGQVPLLSRRAPLELDLLRRRLLERDPARRVQTAEDALALLRRFPGYGDAREELAKLCGSATGVLVPCVAPQRSSPLAAAENATEPRRARAFSGPNAQVPKRPPPPVLRGSSGPPTGATTEVKGRASNDPPTSSAWRTGHTEIIELRAPPFASVSSAATMWPGPSEPSALSSTEPLVGSAGASTEDRATSGTDHDVVAPAVVGDGTVTFHDLQARMFHGAAPGEIRLGTRSALALLGLLLVSMASISTIITWWMVGRRHDAGVTMASMSPIRAEPRQAWTWPFSAATEEPEGAPRAASASEEAILATATDVPRGVPQHGVGEPSAAEVGGHSVSSPPRRDTPTVKPPPRKVEVKIVASTALADTTQVRIGSKVLAADSKPRKISSGRWWVHWRRTPSEAWQRVEKHDFKAGRRWIIHVSKNGPRIRELE